MKIVEDARSLNPKKALDREEKLNSNKGAIDDRAALILFAADQDTPELQQMRYRQIAWLIENRPDAPILCNRAASISNLASPGIYPEMKAAWRKALAARPTDIDVLAAASFGLRTSDTEEVVRFLAPLANQAAPAKIWLAEAFVFAGLGITDVSAKDGGAASAEPTVPVTPFAASSRSALQESNDLVLLTSAYNTIRDLRPAPQDRAPNARRLRRLLRIHRGAHPQAEEERRVQLRHPRHSPRSIDRMPTKERGLLLKKRGKPSLSRGCEEGQNARDLGAFCMDGSGRKAVELEYVSGPLVFHPDAAPYIRQWEYKSSAEENRTVPGHIFIEVNYTLMP
ncbi:MAG: hypothetical protein WDO18_11575 [Acidobacteriota bacterium]